MSSPTANAPGAGKKAVHVKWAGKTIALGTFPSAEADEKCQKAKALTRAWRSTMRPKPSREWVMLELERLGVRVVSGRLGRKAGEDGDEQPPPPTPPEKSKNVNLPPVNENQANGELMGQNPGIERSSSLGWGSEADLQTLMARRNSSLGLSMMGDTLARRGSLSSLGQVMGLEGDPTIPPHRPFVGGGAAAAFEAARHDHYAQKNAEQQRRASSLGLGSLTGGGLAMSVNPNQHYEMLKLHHMNLLNEIQETTLMMNLYQQQQLQQQQQQLQQQASAEQMGTGSSADSQLSMLMQQQSGVDNMFGNGHMGHRSSLGLGGSSLNGFGGPNGLSGNRHPGNLQEMQQNIQNSMLNGSGRGVPENRNDDLSGMPMQKGSGNNGGDYREKKRGKEGGQEGGGRKSPKRSKHEESIRNQDSGNQD